MERIITGAALAAYQSHLASEEKSKNTIDKYMRDIEKLMAFAQGKPLTKERLIAYKDYLKAQGYGARSINSYLAAANGFFKYMEWYELHARAIKIQKEPFLTEKQEITKAEYQRLIRTAKKRKNERLAMIIMTICAMGIRVSELKFLTVETVRRGIMEVDNKGKVRKVFISRELQSHLQRYLKKNKIRRGIIFCTASGREVHRSNIWRDMKALCEEAGVDRTKVFPHNLRHLFAQTHYRLHKDIVRLADILGHSNIETTRIYTRTGSREYQRQLSKMGLVLQC